MRRIFARVLIGVRTGLIWTLYATTAHSVTISVAAPPAGPVVGAIQTASGEPTTVSDAPVDAPAAPTPAPPAGPLTLPPVEGAWVVSFAADVERQVRAAQTQTWVVDINSPCNDCQRKSLSLSLRQAGGAVMTHSVSWTLIPPSSPTNAHALVAAVESALPSAPAVR